MTDSKKPPPTKRQWRSSAVIVFFICLTAAGIWLDRDVRVSAVMGAIGLIAFTYGFYQASKADE